MLQKLTRNIIHGNQFAALSLCGTMQRPRFYTVITKVVKGELRISNTESLEELEATALRELGKGELHLNINNYQVLQKKLPKSEASIDVLVQQAFSNIRIDEFYFEVLRTRQSVFVCVCRKEYVNGLIAQYAKENILITQWSIGPLCMEQLLPFMDVVESIQLPEHTLGIEEGVIGSIEKTSTYLPNLKYTIDSMRVSNEYLVPFSGVLRAFMQFDTEAVSNFSVELSMQQRLFKEHRLFKLGLPVAIGILFILFFANFMSYNFYYEEVDRLEQITQVNAIQGKVLIEKDSIVNQKQKLFDDVIASASSSVSLYVDEMVSIMPEALLLDDIQFQPLRRKIRKKKPILLESNKMLIAGKTRDNLALTDWISDLEDLSFVQDTTLSVDTKGRVTQFRIAINLYVP